jgi:hypothetical protein
MIHYLLPLARKSSTSQIHRRNHIQYPTILHGVKLAFLEMLLMSTRSMISLFLQFRRCHQSGDHQYNLKDAPFMSLLKSLVADMMSLPLGMNHHLQYQPHRKDSQDLL